MDRMIWYGPYRPQDAEYLGRELLKILWANPKPSAEHYKDFSLALKSSMGRKSGGVELEWVIGWAVDGEPEAWKACMDTASDFFQSAPGIPNAFADLIISILQEKKPPRGPGGRQCYNDLAREGTIIEVVDLLCKLVGLHPYRNDETYHKESAISVVARLLPKFGYDPGEGALKQTWKRAVQGEKQYALESPEDAAAMPRLPSRGT